MVTSGTCVVVAGALDVSVGAAVRARDALRLMVRRRIVAGGAKRHRMAAEEAVRAKEAEDAAETCWVYEPRILAAAIVTCLGGIRR